MFYYKYIVLFLILFTLSCSNSVQYLKDIPELDDISLHEEWLIGLIALNQINYPLHNANKRLNQPENELQIKLEKLHYSIDNLKFWRETYYPPVVVLFQTKDEFHFALPGGMICISTGFINNKKKNKSSYDLELTKALSYNLVYTYEKYYLKQFVTLKIKNQIDKRHNEEMKKGIKIASGNLTDKTDLENDKQDKIKLIIAQCTETAINGYPKEVMDKAKEKVDLILQLNGY